MEMRRREYGRPFYASERTILHRIRPQALQLHPRQRFESRDAPYLEEIPSGPIRPRRREPIPQFYEEEPISHTDHYRSYQSSEPDLGPKPLLDPDTIDKLRANLNMVNEKLNQVESRYRNQRDNRNHDRYEDRYQNRFEDRYEDRYQNRFEDRCEDRYEDQLDDRYEYRYEEICDREPERYRRRLEPRPGPSTVHREIIEPNEYIQEEESTKKTIEEIIMVAQALREKLERHDEPILEQEEPIQEHHQELILEHRVAPVPEVQYPIEFYEEGCEPLPPYPRRRPPLLKTPNIKPIPLKAPEVKIPPKRKPTKIPSLLEIKPKKIPSLLELQVEPPEVELIQENVESYNRFAEPRTREICWNCNKVGHRHEVCWFPPKEFCFRCGTQGVNEDTCSVCPEI